MLQIDALAAQRNYEHSFPYSRWHDRHNPEAAGLASNRFKLDVFDPQVAEGRALGGMSFFTMGSCFAREVENALLAFGQRVLSKPDSGSIIDFRSGGYTNRYNTFSMKNELEFAFGLRSYNEASIVEADPEKCFYLDLHSHPAGGFSSFDEAVARRRALTELFARVRSADVFTVTLGLTEAWYDLETGEYLNVSPSKLDISGRYKGRFEFRVTDFDANMVALEHLFELLQGVNPALEIVATVSPVPLLATFSGRDIVIANSCSKATLRACAETWVANHPGRIRYFPSFEMAMNSRPELVWRTDRAHVNSVFVKKIMRKFLRAFGCESTLVASAETVADGLEDGYALASNAVERGDYAEAHRILDEAGNAVDESDLLAGVRIEALLADDRVEEAWQNVALISDWQGLHMQRRRWRMLRHCLVAAIRTGVAENIEFVLDRSIVDVAQMPAQLRTALSALLQAGRELQQVVARYSTRIPADSKSAPLFEQLQRRVQDHHDDSRRPRESRNGGRVRLQA